MRKRQANIELARVVACFIVVMLHTITWFLTNTRLIENSLFIRCFLFDGVPIFWYIMGYFLFAKKDVTLGNRLKKTTLQLLLPAFAVMVFAQIWQEWILADFGKVNFFACLDLHSFDFHNLFGNILKRSASMTFGGHFWYIFAYLEVILWTPLLGYVCVDEPKANKVRRYLMLLAAIFVVYRDVSNISVLKINGDSYPINLYQILNTTLLSVLIGYETFLHREWIKSHASTIRWVGLATYIIACVMKFELSASYMRVDPMDDYFIGIDTVLGYLSSYGLFMAVYCTPIRENSTQEKFILHLGGKSLGIYLIHVCVYKKLAAVGIRNFFYTLYTKDPNNLLVEILCSIVYAVFVFIVTYVIVLILQSLKKLFKILFQKLKSLQRPTVISS